MINISRKNALFLSGLVWFVIGFYLLSLGLRYLVGFTETGPAAAFAPLLTLFQSMFKSVESALVVLIALSLMIGYLKGRSVLRKLAMKHIERIRSIEAPFAIYKTYTLRQALVIVFMMGLGMALKYFQAPLDVRGFIDVAVGSALIQGSVPFFIYGRECPC